MLLSGPGTAQGLEMPGRRGGSAAGGEDEDGKEGGAHGGKGMKQDLRAWGGRSQEPGWLLSFPLG